MLHYHPKIKSCLQDRRVGSLSPRRRRAIRRLCRGFATEITRRFPPHVFQSRQRVSDALPPARYANEREVPSRLCASRQDSGLCNMSDCLVQHMRREPPRDCIRDFNRAVDELTTCCFHSTIVFRLCVVFPM
jgi:hypothetical protein